MSQPDQTISSRSKFDPLVILFSLTLFLSAALMFALEPMVGKMLLPLVGGAPSGWLVAMVYFQLALLAGYYLAHKLSFLTVRKHGIILAALLVVGLFLQPVHMPKGLLEVEEIPEALRIFLVLMTQLTLCFVPLAAFSPTLQRLFASSASPTAHNPYFLFVASNLGSFGGLLLYPVWVERVMGLSAQSHAWLGGYVALIALFCLCCVFVVRNEEKKPIDTTPIDQRTRMRWLLLSFIPSSLLLGVTAHITVDIGAVPFFWILPLSLYLLTFVVAFAREKRETIGWLRWAQPLSVAVLVFASVEHPMMMTNVKMAQMIMPLAAFLLTALQCHYVLAAERPAPSQLTAFYLYIAAGGALGGIFNAFIAPMIFPLPVEFFLVLLASCFVLPPPEKWVFIGKKYIGVLAVILAFAGAFGLFYFRWKNLNDYLTYFSGTVLVVALLGLVGRPKILAGTSLGLGLLALFAFNDVAFRAVERNFFGVVRVYDAPQGPDYMRIMSHGSTLHGIQKIGPAVDITPSSYYHPAGPLGDIFAHSTFRNVGVIGMGTGATVCYKNPGRLFTFYEINDAVPLLAAKFFDYQRACGAPHVVIGDGRKALAVAEHKSHDLLIVDAFTSDAIPVHLLTIEALQEYMNRVEPTGLVAFHISNRFYDLRPPLGNAARTLGLHALYKKYRTSDDNKFGVSSDWVVVGRNAKALGALRQKDWSDLPQSDERVWTDDYSNLLSALRQDW